MNRTTKILVALTMGLSFALAGCNQPKGSVSGNVSSNVSSVGSQTQAQSPGENMPKGVIAVALGEIDGCRIFKVTDQSDPGNTTTFYLASNVGRYGSCGVVKEAGR